jgi:glycosyltransferase involved in cell wall biosynthesis
VRILFIHNRYKYAGGEDFAVESQEALFLEKGDEVKILQFDNSEISNGSALMAGVNSVYNAPSKNLVDEVITSFKPDVIHIHNLFFLASPSVLYAAYRRKVPVVFTLHNYRLICCNALLLRDLAVCELCTKQTLPFSGIKYKCYRSSHAQSALVTAITGLHKMTGTWRNKVHTYIALTEFAKAKFLDSSLRVSEEQMVVLPNFVSDQGIGNPDRESFFLFVGRISPEKGVSQLLECFAQMPQHRIVIAGDGPDKIELEKQYSQYSNISFYGHQSKPEIFGLLKKTQALIFPSIWYEGLPFTIIEAFSTGTPVIAPKLGAMADIIMNEYNGFHFKAGDVQDLRNTVLKFAQLEHEKQGFYSRARKSYEDKYHPDAYYKSIKSIYNNAIGKKAELT